MMPPPPSEGILFPVTGTDETGGEVRSTQVTGKNVLGAALDAVSTEAGQSCRNERNWRFNYTRHFVKSVELSCQSPEAALAVARAGLDHMHEHFEFVRSGRSYSLKQAMQAFTGSFETGFVQGSKPKPERFELEVPYQGGVLKGDALLRQLEAWVRQGVIELSCGSAIAQVAQSEPWLDLSDRHFVLLGAGAAMGPLHVLLGLGAHVIAVDLDRPAVWEYAGTELAPPDRQVRAQSATHALKPHVGAGDCSLRPRRRAAASPSRSSRANSRPARRWRRSAARN